MLDGKIGVFFRQVQTFRLKQEHERFSYGEIPHSVSQSKPEMFNELIVTPPEA